MLLRSLVRVGTKAQLHRPQVFLPRLFCSVNDGGGCIYKSPALPIVSPTKQGSAVNSSGPSTETPPHSNGNGARTNITPLHANVESDTVQQSMAPGNNAKIDSQERANGVSDASAATSAKPGIEKWNTEEVVNWAKGVVRHELAEVLKSQEVDGKSLLTLTKDDLIKPPYSFPGGPAASLALAIADLKTKSDNAADQQRGQQLWSALLAGKGKGFLVKEVRFEKKEGDEDRLTYIELIGGVNWLLEKTPILFERKCNRDLFKIMIDIIESSEKLDQEFQGLVLTGNPGIGKSFDLMYLLFRFAEQKRTIVYEHVEEHKGWLFRTDGSVLHYNALVQPWPKDVTDALNDPLTIYLFDPAGKGGPPKVKAFTIVASSPDPRNFREFFKRVAIKLRMPGWGLEAIKAGASVVGVDRGMAVDRFEVFGGIPRYVFDNKKYFAKELQATIDTCNLIELFSTVGNPNVLEKESHKLFHYVVDPTNYSDYSINFASLYVRGALVNRLVNYEIPLMQAVALATESQKLYGGFRGSLFEGIVHNRFPKEPHSYKVKNLETGQDGTLADYAFPTGPLKVEIPHRLSDITNFTPEVYYHPVIYNEPVVDAIVRYKDFAFGFQATIRERHPINKTELDKIVKASGVDMSKFFLVFVVPSSRFQGWKTQPIEDPSEDEEAKKAKKEEKKEAKNAKKEQKKKVSPGNVIEIADTPSPSPPPTAPPQPVQLVLEFPWAKGTPLEA